MTISGPSGAAKKKVSVERFWLCSECAETMTLKFDRCRYRKVKVKVIPLSSLVTLPPSGRVGHLQQQSPWARMRTISFVSSFFHIVQPSRHKV